MGLDTSTDFCALDGSPHPPPKLPFSLKKKVINKSLLKIVHKILHIILR